MITIIKAFFVGLGRSLNALGLALLIFFILFIVTAPFGFAMKKILGESIGSSRVHEDLRAGFDMAWYGEFEAEAEGLAATFGPDQTAGVLPMLNNAERFLNGQLFKMNGSILAVAIAVLLFWTFMTGGLIDRFASGHARYERVGFLSQAGRYFFPFLFLLILAAVAYWAIFVELSPVLFEQVDIRTRDATSEWTVLYWTMGAYAILCIFFMLAWLFLEYARISMVVNRRLNPIGGFFRGLGFVLAHPFRTIILFLLILAVQVALVYGYARVPQLLDESTYQQILASLAIGFVYIFLLIFIKLWFIAGQTAMYQYVHYRGGDGEVAVEKEPTTAPPEMDVEEVEPEPEPEPPTMSEKLIANDEQE
jgi:hypothetical protein